MTTDTTEHGLERLIRAALTRSECEPGAAPKGSLVERSATYGVGSGA